MTTGPIRPVEGGVRITLHVQPRAARTEPAGLHGGALKLRIAAPPVDGAANEAVTRFLAERLGIPARNMAIVSGQTSRRKVVHVDGADAAAVARALDLP